MTGSPEGYFTDEDRRLLYISNAWGTGPVPIIIPDQLAKPVPISPEPIALDSDVTGEIASAPFDWAQGEGL